MPAESSFITQLQSQIKGTVIAPGARGFADNVARWNMDAQKVYNVAIVAADVQDVVAAVRLANQLDLSIVTCGGGHGMASSIEGGVVVDLRNMRKVQVDTESKRLSVQGGAVWSDVNKASMAHGLATVSATVSHVGVGGFTLGGGYGWLTGKHGLACDNLVGATVVLSSGEVVKASAAENSDLFWAIRGGGANFGIVTEFVFQAHDQRNCVFGGSLIFSESQMDGFADAVSSWLKTRDENEAAFAIVRRVPEVADQSVICFSIFYNGSAEDGQQRFKSFFDLKPIADCTREMSYLDHHSGMDRLMGPPRGLRRHWDSVSFKSFSAEMLRDVVTKHNSFYQGSLERQEVAAHSAIMYEFLHAGKIASIAPDATAFPHREISYNALTAMTYADEVLASDVGAFASAVSAAIIAGQGQSETGFVYGNYGTTGQSAETVFGASLDRLKDVKRAYDPKSRFSGAHPIAL